MRLYKLLALLFLEFRVLSRTKWKLAEYFYFPLTTIIIWGFFALYASSFAAEAGLVILIVNVYWNFSLVTQSSTNQAINVDNWSGSMKEMFMSGITHFEYITAKIIFSIILSIGVLLVMLSLALSFGFVLLFTLPGEIILLALGALVAAIALALLVAGGGILVGREYDFFAWSALQAFILFSAPFFPVSSLPPVMQSIAIVMPYTAVFEGLRAVVSTGSLPLSLALRSVALPLIYLLIMIPFYHFSFRRGQKTGELVRMD